jgi:hypothetical protein
MNKSHFKDSIGKNLRLRPAAIRRTSDGVRQPTIDDYWKLNDVTDNFAKLSNPRTGHLIDLGLDNVKEFRTPDFLLLRCQLVLEGARVRIEPIISANVEKNITGFESLLVDGQWRKEFIDYKEIWVSEADNTFQIEVGEMGDQFEEEWVQCFPNHSCKKGPVYLTIGGTRVKELLFVLCDGGNIFVPCPEIVSSLGTDGNRTRHFRYRRGSLEYKVGELIGEFYIYESLEGVAKYCKIEVQ